jgi:ABC-2 type transport system permease protein
MMMLMRQAMDSNIGWWEPLLGGVGVALFTLLCVWAAGRVFRIGILMQGKAPSLKQLIQWAYRG